MFSIFRKKITIKTKLSSIHVVLHNKDDSIPTVFLHGFTGSANSWNEVISKLDSYDRNNKINYTIALDIVGHGNSNFNDLNHDYTIDDWCDDFSKILDSLNIEKQ